MREGILAAIYEAIDELNDALPSERQLVKEPNTLLFGRDARLTSLDLVNLITLTEEMLEDNLDVIVALADERAMSQKSSPFRSVQSLADYVMTLVEA